MNIGGIFLNGIGVGVERASREPVFVFEHKELISFPAPFNRIPSKVYQRVFATPVWIYIAIKFHSFVVASVRDLAGLSGMDRFA